MSSNQELSVKNSNQVVSLLIIMVSTFILGISLGATAVIFPTTMAGQGFTTSLIGFVMSLETIAAVLVCFMIFKIFQLAGLRIGLLLSTGLRVPPIIALAYYSSVESWFLFALIYGIGVGAFLLQLQTWVNSIPFEKSRGFKIAMFGTALSLGLSLGPVVLQFVDVLSPVIYQFSSVFGLEITNFSHQSGFYIIGFFSLLAAIPVILGLPFMPVIKAATKTPLIQLINDNKGVMYAQAFGGVTMFGVAAFITIYGMANGLDLKDASLCLTFFMLGGLLCEAPLSWVSDQFDRGSVVIVAVLLSLVCSAYLPIAIYENKQAWTLLFIWGGVIGGIYSITLTMLGEKYDSDELVSVNAAYSAIENTGGIFGAVFIGIAMDLFGSDGLPYVILFAGLSYFAFALRLYEVE